MIHQNHVAPNKYAHYSLHTISKRSNWHAL